MTLKTSIITGTLELINCENLTVVIEEMIPTITIDNSTKVTLKTLPENVKDIVIARCNEIEIVYQEKGYPLPVNQSDVSDDWENSQYITRNVEGVPVTEKVLRVGGGYISTKRENDEAVRKQRLLEEKMVEYIRGSLKGISAR